MSRTKGLLGPLLILLLTAVLLLTSSGPVYSQSNTRSFQMVLWTDPSRDANSDIAVFWGNETQPAGRSIWVSVPGPVSLNTYSNIDWSQIVAIEIDEPYSSIDNVLRHSDGTIACQAADLNGDIAPIDAELAQRAAELQALAPKARFWVDFTHGEALWMQTCTNPQAFNRTYIDVISADWTDDGNGSNNTIASAQPFYTVVAAHRAKPDQQLAMIPGVYYAPVDQTTHLQGFFNYANQTNTDPTTGQPACNLPLGPRGVTGIFDGCPMWIVMGWLSGTVTVGNTTYVGMLAPTAPASATIKIAWENELAVPLAPALAHQLTPAEIIQPVLQLLLN